MEIGIVAFNTCFSLEMLIISQEYLRTFFIQAMNFWGYKKHSVCPTVQYFSGEEKIRGVNLLLKFYQGA